MSEARPPTTGDPRTADLHRVPADLPFELRKPSGAPLQWLVYDVEVDNGPLQAWIFAPQAFFPPGRRSLTTLGAVARTREYAAHAGVAWRMADGLASAPNTRGENISRIVRTGRSGSGPFWMTLPRPRTPASAAPGDWQDLRGLIRDLAAAVRVLHGLGILHLDVHPDMIGIGHHQRLRLNAFGVDVRRALPLDAESNRTLGRSGYSAPELWDASGRSALGPWTDVYGVSATCFYWVTGFDPPDFRARIKGPSESRGALAKALWRNLRGFPETMSFVNAVAAGLSPRIEDRPADIGAWLSLFPADEIRLREDAGASEPPAAGRAGANGAAQDDKKSSTSPRVDPGKAYSPKRDRAASGQRGLASRTIGPVIGAASILLVLLWLIWQPDSSARKDPGNVQNSIVQDTIATPAPVAPPPAPSIPSGVLVGLAYRDDPAAFDRILAGLWGSLPPGHSASRYFRDFRGASGACANPLRLHLREDDRGLLVLRPGGLIWITEWNPARSTPGRIGVVITQVQGESGSIDVPGLVGSSRAIEMSGDALHVTYLGSDDAGERDSYQACEEGRPQP